MLLWVSFIDLAAFSFMRTCVWASVAECQRVVPRNMILWGMQDSLERSKQRTAQGMSAVCFPLMML